MHKNKHVPGINTNTRTFGLLRGGDDESVPRQQPSPPQLHIQPPPGYVGNMPPQYAINQQFYAQNPANMNGFVGYHDGENFGHHDLEENLDNDEELPLIGSCCLCCNLGIGILLGALSFFVFDAIFLAKKAQNVFFAEATNYSPFAIEEPTGSLETAFQITSIILTAFACFSSFILITSVCLCGVPEKLGTLKFVTRYWMFQIGLNALFQSIETLFNTLPDPDSVFVMELPGLGIPEIVGQVAVIVTWGFTVLYLFAYFFMIVMILSHATVLENMAKKSIHHFFERRNQNQAKFDSDLQSQVTYTSRLSGSSVGSIQSASHSPALNEEGNYQDIGAMSDMTGLEDIYSLRKPGLPSIPEMTQMPNMIMNNGSPDLLQAQLAMLHPVQKFQFLQQQIQNHQMATHIQRQMNPQTRIPQQKTDDEDSNVSTKSKPNSNGFNVRFNVLEEAKTNAPSPVQYNPHISAPSYGPRPPCYVPDWSPTDWQNNPQMINRQMPLQMPVQNMPVQNMPVQNMPVQNMPQRTMSFQN